MIIDSQWVKNLACAVGFDACGIARVDTLQEMGLADWLSARFHGDMHFMEEHQQMRVNPTQLHEGAQSVISVLVGYKSSRLMEGNSRVAQYAYGDDYHIVLKQMLYQLLGKIREHVPQFEAKPCVDTAPISDKLWAVHAGLGWIGRNTLLVNPRLGSYCFIGELVTTAVFNQYDTPLPNGCGSCHSCIDACPNHALQSKMGNNVFWLDARRCASYHTIENRAEKLPMDIRLSGYAFGCDCCQMVCPYNQQAAIRYELSDDRKSALESLVEAGETDFKHFTRHSAMSRIKYSQWQRNLSHHA